MREKKSFSFNINKSDHGDWELWYENFLSNQLNASFFGFNAGGSAWGDILQIFSEEIFPFSDLYRIELFGRAANVNHTLWPVDIDIDGEFGDIGKNLCTENVFDVLPQDHNDQLYYVYQAIEENDLLEYGIYSSKVLFHPDLDYSDCYANLHRWTDMAIKGINPSEEDMFSNWITPDCFYGAFYGLSAIAKDAPLYGFDEKPFPYFLKLYKYKDDDEEVLSQEDIKKIILNVSNALDVEVFGFFYS